jgi:uncharacterized protein (DUF433 family)
MSVEEVAKEYGLKVEQVRGALVYAGSLLEQEVHHPLPA